MSQSEAPPNPDRRCRENVPAAYEPQIKTGLKWKLAALILFVICGMSLFTLFFFQFSFKKFMLGEFAKRGEALADSFARDFARYLDGPQDRIPDSAIAACLNFPDVRYVVVRDQAGNTIAGKDLPSTAAPAGRAGYFRREQPTYEFNAPLQTAAFQGAVRIGLSSHVMDQQFRTVGYLLAAGSTLFLALGLVLSLLLSQLIINPIQRLARAMKIVADQGDAFDENGMPPGLRFRRMEDVDLNITTGDEIEQLAEEFRVMVKKLEASYANLETILEEKSRMALEKSRLAEDLKELNRKNEALVKERTREIVEKNLRLYEISEELQFQKEELISMNEQLEKSSRMKSEFLASMSHELRTPLNAIIGFAEVLREKMFGELNERQEKYLSNIFASGQHLLQLVNNILDIAKVEAGKMKLNLENFFANRVIEEVHNIIRTLAYKKNIELQLDLAPEVVIRGDAAKFKQILYNLLSNAIKFTDEKGKVVIRTQRIPAGTMFQGGSGAAAFATREESLLLAVEDNGIGIRLEDQERIFREFEQADQTLKRRYEGTGLGLALTRNLVHLHGGEIWVSSQPGKGTIMTVILPVTVEADSIEEKGEA